MLVPKKMSVSTFGGFIKSMKLQCTASWVSPRDRRASRGRFGSGRGPRGGRRQPRQQRLRSQRPCSVAYSILHAPRCLWHTPRRPRCLGSVLSCGDARLGRAPMALNPRIAAPARGICAPVVPGGKSLQHIRLNLSLSTLIPHHDYAIRV